MCLAESTGTLLHVEAIPMKVLGHAPRSTTSRGVSHVCIDRIRRHTTPLTARNDIPPHAVSALHGSFLTYRNAPTLRETTGAQTGMMSSMHATTDPLDVETFAKPAQQHRFIAAMNRIAASRVPGAPVRVYISVGPRSLNSPKWDRLLERVTERLPDGVEVLYHHNVFARGQAYDWDSIVDSLDGLVVLAEPKRMGSRVYRLGPVARLELRSLIAHKPVLLDSHNLGLIPVIDCKSQILAPDDAPRLKLIAPKRWQQDTPTLKAALNALTPAGTVAEEEERAVVPGHLKHPVGAPPR